MTEIIKLANKDDIRAVKNIVHMFKKEDEHLSRIKREREDVKKIKIIF